MTANGAPAQVGALDGIRVADFSQMLAGPLAAMALGDLGATVVKFERPQGDPARSIGQDGSMFAIANRNKRSVCVDLRQPDGRAVARKFLATADVLIEAFRPGVMARWQLAHEDVAALAPRLVYASVVGFGSRGPYRDRGGIDAVLQAESGMMNLTGEPSGPPMKVGFQPVDSLAGVSLAQGICAALLRRERTGRGGKVEVRLLDCAMYLQAFQFAEYAISGRLPTRSGNSVPHAAPSDLVRTSDGYLMLAAYLEDQWAKLCVTLDMQWMAGDERFATNHARVRHRAELIQVLEGRLRERTSQEWFETLTEAGLLVGRVMDYDAVTRDPQVVENRPFVATTRPSGAAAMTPRLPFVLDDEEPGAVTPPPPLGANTREVLAEIGLGEAEVDSLIERNIVACGPGGAA
jgi:crotonobetainyl-CoA:carnitine CoA-transferase CaiB-like acyl-CoA transferase